MGSEPGDPRVLEASDIDELFRFARSLGANESEIAESSNLGELALDLSLRPRGSSTLAGLRDELDVDTDELVRLVSALGLPDQLDQVLTVGEEATIRLFVGVSTELLGPRVTLRAARVTGSAMARIASTLVEGFRLQIEVPRLDAGTPYSDMVKTYTGVTQTVLPDFVASLDAILRHQILVIAKQMWSTDAERSAMTVERTVGFVDLVGYTALVESLSIGQLAELLSDFDERSAEAVARFGGSVVKMIGDEVMFVTEDPTDACRIALQLKEGFGAGGKLPVRVGLATGEMVSVLGDLFGANVNLGARLMAAAEPGTIVLSEQTQSAVSGFDVDPLPPLTLKGIPHPVTAYALR